MIYSPNAESQIREYSFQLDHERRTRQGQRRIDELKEIEKYRDWESAGLIRRTWWWLIGSPELRRGTQESRE